MSISDIAFGGGRRDAVLVGLNGAQLVKTKLYGTIFGFGMIILATPLVLVLGLKALLDLPQPLFLPLGVAILAVDLYLAAWLGRLFAETPRSLRLPRRAAWRLPAGMGWKLAVTLLLAPWPFDAAFALLGNQPDILSQVIVLLLAAAAALAAVAVLLSVLAEAWRMARPAQG